MWQRSALGQARAAGAEQPLGLLAQRPAHPRSTDRSRASTSSSSTSLAPSRIRSSSRQTRFPSGAGTARSRRSTACSTGRPRSWAPRRVKCTDSRRSSSASPLRRTSWSARVSTSPVPVRISATNNRMPNMPSRSMSCARVAGDSGTAVCGERNRSALSSIVSTSAGGAVARLRSAMNSPCRSVRPVRPTSPATGRTSWVTALTARSRAVRSAIFRADSSASTPPAPTSSARESTVSVVVRLPRRRWPPGKPATARGRPAPSAGSGRRSRRPPTAPRRPGTTRSGRLSRGESEEVPGVSMNVARRSTCVGQSTSSRAHLVDLGLAEVEPERRRCGARATHDGSPSAPGAAPPAESCPRAGTRSRRGCTRRRWSVRGTRRPTR